MNYYEFVKNYLGTDSCKEKSKYCNIGTTFCVCREEAEGCYWFYETDSFIVEIHDFFIKKDIVYSSALNMDQFMSFSSSISLPETAKALVLIRRCLQALSILSMWKICTKIINFFCTVISHI